jgi:aryl-alcohol dehydrogenase-like predicted oxidoreductase
MKQYMTSCIDELSHQEHIVDQGRARPGGTLVIGSDMPAGRLGFGAMRLTGPGRWGEFPDRDAGIALPRQVVDAGVTFIDTADADGPHTNEVLIRDAPHPYPAGLVIATKGDSSAAARTTPTSARSAIARTRASAPT